MPVRAAFAHADDGYGMDEPPPPSEVALSAVEPGAEGPCVPGFCYPRPAVPPPHTAPRAYALLALAAAGCGSFESAELPNGDIRMNVEAIDTGDGKLVVDARLNRPDRGMFMPRGGGPVDLSGGDRIVVEHGGATVALEKPAIGAVKGGYRGVVASRPGQTLLVTFARTSQPSLGPTQVEVPTAFALTSPISTVSKLPLLGGPSLSLSRASDTLDVSWSPPAAAGLSLTGPCVKTVRKPGAGRVGFPPGSLSAPTKSPSRPVPDSCTVEVRVTRTASAPAPKGMAGGTITTKVTRVVLVRSTP